MMRHMRQLSNSVRLSAMEALLQWLESQCEAEKMAAVWRSARVGMEVDAASASGDRVLRTTGPLAKGLRWPVPPACVLTADVVAASPVGKALAGLDRYTLFAVFLLQEQRRGAASFWRHYLAVLPTDIAFHPITYVVCLA